MRFSFQSKLKSLFVMVVIFSVGVLMLAAVPAHAGDKFITLGWAAWDPANALVELSKDFTKKTGIEVKFVFVPWTNFADRMLNELNQGGKTFDVLIGDSQWIGLGAVYGHYVKLNDFFKKEGIDMNTFLYPAVYAYSTWPKGSKNYYALPAFGDAVGWAYRKDWFERPELQKEFMKKHGYKLGVPKNWTQLLEMAQFFQGRVIDGKKRYGAAIYTERGSEGITMGVLTAMFAWDAKLHDPKNPYHMDGYINGPNAIAALKFYKKLYKTCSPPGHSDAYMSADLDTYDSGQTAFEMNFFAFFPGINKSKNVGFGKSGFFANPPQVTHGTMIGGQGMSVVSYSDKKDLAFQYLKWFATPEVQKKWWGLGGYTCSKAVLTDPNFVKSQPYAQGFLDSMKMVHDFWQEPTYVELLLAMQKRIHDYVVGDKGTAKQALDLLRKDWHDVFEEEGKYK